MVIFALYMKSTEPVVLPHKLRNTVRSLHRSADRNDLQLFLAEGVRVCQDLLASSMRVESVVVAENANDATMRLGAELVAKGGTLYEATPTDMAIMADASTPQDILAVLPFKEERPLGNRIVILDAVADPGNVGTIIRSAAWFGFTDVVLGRGGSDAYNPKVVRSAAGALFRMNVVRNRDVAAMLRDELSTYTKAAAVRSGGDDPSMLRNANQLCLVIGSEAHGLNDSTLDACTVRISIPGGNGTESLNAAVAASILCYEAAAR